mgnify:CR=1 FL=1
MITDIANLGVAGLSVVLMWHIVSTGLKSNTEALNQLREVLTALTKKIGT